MFREGDWFSVSRTFFFLPPMLSQTGIFGHTQYWSQSNSMALSYICFTAVVAISGIWRFGINSGFDTKFCGLRAHNFLLFVTSFAYCSLEIDRIYSSPEVKHAHVGLARPGTRALKLSWKQMEFRGFHLGIFRWKLRQSRCTKALNWHVTTIFWPILVSLNRPRLQNCFLKCSLGPMGGDLHRYIKSVWKLLFTVKSGKMLRFITLL